jgi:hypothetical protein
MQIAEGQSGIGIGKHQMADMRGMPPHEALVQLWREGAMYRGLGPVLARGVPVHMAYLPVYDFVASVLGEYS